MTADVLTFVPRTSGTTSACTPWCQTKEQHDTSRSSCVSAGFVQRDDEQKDFDVVVIASKVPGIGGPPRSSLLEIRLDLNGGCILPAEAEALCEAVTLAATFCREQADR